MTRADGELCRQAGRARKLIWMKTRRGYKASQLTGRPAKYVQINSVTLHPRPLVTEHDERIIGH
ncbi:hypothetical protein EYF80_040651 [Liparis tanakae]|uniref:Uncharacterized protein n=1 Tax=Liparis tanakae TaxID=230148 RepID=A0A4Z2G870_9TELE|nr:hypothetical protein EYF80_040651 [Liparis tanakae]